MKKITLLLLISFLISLPLFLVAQDCSNSTSQIDLNANNVRARLQQSGSLWWDGADGKYFVPKQEPGIPEVSSMFAGGLWMGGFDPAGNLKLAAVTYGSATGQTDYWPGPLDENGTTNADNCLNWDKHFEVMNDEIETHIADFEDGNIDDDVAQNILGWPARGNPHFFDIHGFELPFASAGLAPFYDVNGNALYEPMEGDYPLTKSATQAIWWVFNDNGGLHTQTQGVPIQMEIQMMAYAYECAVEAINNATYYDVKMINRSVEDIDSAYISLWVDPDLGCYTDDYVGCIPSENLAFVYNTDALDGEIGCECLGLNTYCESIPVTGIKLMEGPLNEFGEELGMSSFVVYSNGGVGNPPPGQTDPNSAIEYYRLMTGHYVDGSPMMDPDGNPTSYLYPGNPGGSDEGGWSMCGENEPAGDRRMLMNFGPFTLQPGAVNQITFAVITELDVPHPCPDITPLQANAWYVANHSCSPFVSTKPQLTFESSNVKLLPNPFSNAAVLTLERDMDQIASVEIYNSKGQLLRTYNNLSANVLQMKRGNLSAGMYIYKIQTRNGLVKTGKFVIE